MRPLSECRKYEVLTEAGSWEPVQWTQLDEGDIVRILASDGKPDAFVGSMPNPFVISEHPHLLVDPVSLLKDKK
jgi:hypothetical protein